MRSHPYFFAATCLAAVCFSSAVWADTVTLKDGKRLEGTIVSCSYGKNVVVYKCVMTEEGGMDPQKSITRVSLDNVQSIHMEGLEKFNQAEKLLAAGKAVQAIDVYALPPKGEHDSWAEKLMKRRRLDAANLAGRYDQAVEDWLFLMGKTSNCIDPAPLTTCAPQTPGKKGSVANAQAVKLLEAHFKKWDTYCLRRHRSAVLRELQKVYKANDDQEGLKSTRWRLDNPPPKPPYDFLFGAGGRWAKKYVYVVDCSAASSSMITQINKNIQENINRLSGTCFFQIILAEKNGFRVFEKNRMLPSVYRHRIRIGDFIAKARIGGQADVATVLKEAARMADHWMPGKTMIYLYSPGTLSLNQEAKIVKWLDDAKEKAFFLITFLYNNADIPGPTRQLSEIAKRGNGKFRSYVIPKPTPASQPAASQPATLMKTPLIEFPAEAPNNVVFLVDVSKSMAKRFDVVRGELIRAVNTLKPTQNFSMIFFGNVVPMQLKQSRLHSATNAAQKEAVGFIRQISPSGPSFLLPGLREGIKTSNSAAKTGKYIVLISDGKFAETPNEIYTFFEKLEQADSNPLRVDTIYFGQGDEKVQAVLEAIAQGFGGQFKKVVLPKSKTPSIKSTSP